MAATGLVSAVNDEALAAQRAAAAANPKDASELVRLAERLLGSSSTSSDATAEAERALRAAVALRPHDDQAQNLLGTLLQSQPGRWQEAADAYQAALDARPTSGDAYHNLGTIHQRLGRYDDARRMYEASLKVRERAHKQPPPQQPTITHSHALSLRVSLTLHAQLSPGVPNAYVSLASISKPPENAKLLKHALSLRPTDADSYARLANALAPTPLGGAVAPSESSLRSALTAMGHAARLAPLEHQHHLELGRLRVALATQLLRDGADDLTKAAELKSGAAEATNAAALLQRTLGRTKESAARFGDGHGGGASGGQ